MYTNAALLSEMHSGVKLYLRFVWIERRFIDKLTAIQRGGSMMSECYCQLAHSEFGEETIREAAHQEGQASGVRYRYLVQGGPEATAACDLDHEVVDQPFCGI